MSAAPSPWTRDYPAVRPRTLVWQLVVLVAVELVIFRRYDAEQTRFHWSTHWLDAVAFTALLLARLLITGRPGPRYLIQMLVGFHVYAIVPDLMFSEGSAHTMWMNVFLGHIAEHYLPGGVTARLAIAVLSTAAYVAALTLWLRRRWAEATLPSTVLPATAVPPTTLRGS